LLLQRCASCSQVTFPPTARYPACLAPLVAWTKSSGRGTVYSFVVYRRAYHPGLEDQLSYVVALVELAKGPRLISNLVDCEPRSVQCDMPVEVVFDDVTEIVILYKFRPSKERSWS
jgi:uncharacterized OB-fold protein